MTPRTTDPRPIRRAPASRDPALPAGTARILAALRPWRHQLKPGSGLVLATIDLADLHDVRDAGLLEDLVGRRLALPENRRHLVGPFDVRDRAGGSPASSPVPLWSPPR